MRPTAESRSVPPRPEGPAGRAADLESVLRALADPRRRAILEIVRERPYAVGEIAERVSVTQQAVSHHLGVLRRAGLVRERRYGTRHLFVVRTDGLEVARRFLDGFWPDRLALLKRVAEESVRGAGRDG